MTKKFFTTCQLCEMTFIAKSREQIREMNHDHLVSHYAMNDDMLRVIATVERVSKLVNDYKANNVLEVPVELLLTAIAGEQQ